MQILKTFPLKRNRPLEHREKQYTERPYINRKTFVAFVTNDFRSQVGRCTTLLLNNFVFVY